MGSDAAYSAAFRQLGIIRVDDVDEMLDIAAYFSVGRLPAGKRVAVLTASGGAGAWLADACAARGLELPPPDPSVQAAISAFIPSYGSVANPVDITAQAVLGGGFERALGYLAHSAQFDTVLAVATLVRAERFFETLPDLRSALDGADVSAVFYSYTRATAAVSGALADMGIPCYPTPGRTARAVGAATDYAAFLQQVDQVRVLADGASRAVERWPELAGAVSETGARAYLKRLGLASPAERLAHSADEAVACFAALGEEPVALKVQSPDLAHKTDTGGVRLGLRTTAEVRSAYESIRTSMRTARPNARIDGVLVQHMAPAGWETFVAARREPLLGPMVVVGTGGLDVEALGDIALRLAPVCTVEARAMVGELRGARSRTPAELDALTAAVVRVSELAGALPDGVRDVELNPLLVLPAGQGVLMLDAAIAFDREEDEGRCC